MIATTPLAMVAAAVFFSSSALGAFDPLSNSNMAVYWGQGPDQLPLSHYCADPNIDIINIGFLNQFPEQTRGYPGTNFGNQCGQETYTNKDGSVSPLLSNCPLIGPDIKTCQQAGKKVLLSLGGAYPSNQNIANDQSAEAFAEFLWTSFGPVSDVSAPRPFGDAVIDGFDFDIESVLEKGEDASDLSRGYSTLVNSLRKYYKIEQSKKFYISGAPQCVVPDAHLANAIETSYFDFIFVQFYNTPQCSARAFFDHTYGGPGSNISYSKWVDFLHNSVNKNAKIFLGLPGSNDKNVVYDAAMYLNPDEAKQIIRDLQCGYPDAFGGVMIYDATASENNKVGAVSYADALKQDLASNECPKQQSSSSIPSSTKATTAPPSSISSTAVSITPSGASSSSQSLPIGILSSSSSSASLTVPSGSAPSSSRSTTSSSIFVPSSSSALYPISSTSSRSTGSSGIIFPSGSVTSSTSSGSSGIIFPSGSGSSKSGTAPYSSKSSSSSYTIKSGTAIYTQKTGTAPYISKTGTAPFSQKTGTAPYTSKTGTAPSGSATASYTFKTGTASYSSKLGTAPYPSKIGTAPSGSGTAVTSAISSGILPNVSGYSSVVPYPANNSSSLASQSGTSSPSTTGDKVVFSTNIVTTIESGSSASVTIGGSSASSSSAAANSSAATGEFFVPGSSTPSNNPTTVAEFSMSSSVPGSSPDTSSPVTSGEASTGLPGSSQSGFAGSLLSSNSVPAYSASNSVTSSSVFSIQDVVTTVYVSSYVTTCPITQTASSSGSQVTQIGSMVSTVYKTITSTICTKCVAPPTPAPTQQGISAVGQSPFPTTPAVTGSPPYGPASSGSIQSVVTTIITYTTLTTCPVTNTITSGTSTSTQITQSVSTITSTLTSTICTQCIAPGPQTTTNAAIGGIPGSGNQGPPVPVPAGTQPQNSASVGSPPAGSAPGGLSPAGGSNTQSQNGAQGGNIPQQAGSSGSTTPSQNGAQGGNVPQQGGSSTPPQNGAQGGNVPQQVGSSASSTPPQTGGQGTNNPQQAGSSGSTTPPQNSAQGTGNPQQAGSSGSNAASPAVGSPAGSPSIVQPSVTVPSNAAAVGNSPASSGPQSGSQAGSQPGSSAGQAPAASPASAGKSGPVTLQSTLNVVPIQTLTIVPIPLNPSQTAKASSSAQVSAPAQSGQQKGASGSGSSNNGASNGGAASNGSPSSPFLVPGANNVTAAASGSGSASPSQGSGSPSPSQSNLVAFQGAASKMGNGAFSIVAFIAAAFLVL